MSEVENWLPVVGYEGLYEVSNLGHVRSLDRVSTGKRPRKLRGRTLSLGLGSNGNYRIVGLCREGQSVSHSVHRLVCEAFHGPPGGLHTRHLNGDGHDNRAENLAWGTVVENMADKRTHGTSDRLNRTHCPKGHEHAEFNRTEASRRIGRRGCKSCHRSTSWANARGMNPHGPEATEYGNQQFERLLNEYCVS